MTRLFAILCAVTCAGLAAAIAHGQSPSKKHSTYAEWPKKAGLSEVVSVSSPGRIIFLAGVGANDEVNGDLMHPGDLRAQCQYVYAKIKRFLEAEGARMNDIAKIVTYLTDIRQMREMSRCRREALGDGPKPVHTSLNVSQLADPGMLIEVDVIAVLAK
jgi:enamine deaminase RidA (YjgF/YER057c/UK114 family)